MSEESLVCAVCQKNSHLKCSRCLRVAYCSKEHQKLDWGAHKKSCERRASKCFKVATDKKLGRHLVSSRAISSGEIVLEEFPLVTGPPQPTPPICLGCYKLLNLFNSRNCSRCNWPVCSRDCENSAAHKPECEITTNFKKEKVTIAQFQRDHPSYQCIIVLRCLYLKNADRAAWEKVNNLESHFAQRKNSKRYQEDIAFVVQFIPRFFNFHEFSEEEILKITGIVEVNALLIPLEESSFIAIYDKGSLFEHSCLPNCSKSVTRDGKLVIRAEREIKKGEHLSISYTDVLAGKSSRQKHLLNTKYFLCKCERCSDPTELETHFNSFKCLRMGCSGYCAMINSRTPLQYYWQCTTCLRYATVDDLKLLSVAVNVELLRLNKENAESCKEILMKFKNFLHPNHSISVMVEIHLIKCYVDEVLHGASYDDLNYAINVNKNLIDLASKLLSADKKFMGFLYFRLCALLSELWRRKSLCGEVDNLQFKQHLLMKRYLAHQAYSCLKTETPCLEEVEMAEETLKTLRDISKKMEEIQISSVTCPVIRFALT